MNELTLEETEYIIEYTGMDLLLEHSMDRTPVVFYSRNGNILDFITIMSDELNNL